MQHHALDDENNNININININENELWSNQAQYYCRRATYKWPASDIVQLLLWRVVEVTSMFITRLRLNSSAWWVIWMSNKYCIVVCTESLARRDPTALYDVLINCKVLSLNDGVRV